MKRIFLTGIGTGVGKTFISSILVEALRADYWKPLQCGDLHDSDTDKVRGLVTNKMSRFHKEAYCLAAPMAPFFAARRENREIDLDRIKVPDPKNLLVIEGAGGVLVPLDQEKTILDFMKKVEGKVLLVSQNYLGSLNHTLLTVQALRQAGLPLLGILFNGPENPEGENFLIQKTGLRGWGSFREEEVVSPEVISQLSQQWLQKYGEAFLENLK